MLGACLLQGRRARTGGCTGCKDIVHQQDTASGKRMSPFRAEGSGDVSPPFGVAKSGLWRSRPQAAAPPRPLESRSSGSGCPREAGIG